MYLGEFANLIVGVGMQVAEMELPYHNQILPKPEGVLCKL